MTTEVRPRGAMARWGAEFLSCSILLSITLMCSGSPSLAENHAISSTFRKTSSENSGNNLPNEGMTPDNVASRTNMVDRTEKRSISFPGNIARDDINLRHVEGNSKYGMRTKRSSAVYLEGNVKKPLKSFHSVGELLGEISGNNLAARSKRSVSKDDIKIEKVESQQVSSYTSYDLKPSETGHHEKSSSKGHKAGHEAGFKKLSGHKGGEGAKKAKGFHIARKGSHGKKGASGHKSGGAKKYAGGHKKSHHHKHSSGGKKGAKSSSKGQKSHKSKGGKADGFKNKHKGNESGGKKNFFDKSGKSGYHSKWDHFDSYHESSVEGSEQGKKFKEDKTHNKFGKKAFDEGADHHKEKAGHKASHGQKAGHKHDTKSNKEASKDSKHKAKH